MRINEARRCPVRMRTFSTLAPRPLTTSAPSAASAPASNPQMTGNNPLLRLDISSAGDPEAYRQPDVPPFEGFAGVPWGRKGLVSGPRFSGSHGEEGALGSELVLKDDVACKTGQPVLLTKTLCTKKLPLSDF